MAFFATIVLIIVLSIVRAISYFLPRRRNKSWSYSGAATIRFFSARRAWQHSQTAEILVKLKMMSSEYVRLHHALEKTVNRGLTTHRYNLVPFLKLRGYSDWLLCNCEDIKERLKAAYHADVLKHPSWQEPAVLRGAYAAVDRLTDDFMTASNRMLRCLLDSIPNAKEREYLRERMVQELSHVRVSDAKWRVSYTGIGLIMEATTPPWG